MTFKFRCSAKGKECYIVADKITAVLPFDRGTGQFVGSKILLEGGGEVEVLDEFKEVILKLKEKE